MRSWTVIAAGVAALALTTAEAIVMRHDRSEQLYVELARKFPATVTFTAPFENDIAGAGTLIDPRWVLTAGHVAMELEPGDLAHLGDAVYEVDSVVPYGDWKGIKTWDDVKRDIALVKLRTAVTGIKPAKPYTGKDEAGMVLTFVGAGSHGTGLTGPVAHDTMLRAATNRVVRVDGSELVFRFDAPGDPDVTALEGVSGEGDSGGPAYLELNGELFVVGVSSAQDSRPAGHEQGHYGVLEFYPRVSSFAPWIRAIIKAH